MSMEVDLDGLFRPNYTFDDDEDYQYEGDPEPGAGGAAHAPVLYSLGLVLGLVGNGLLLALLAKKRRSWSTTDTFVLHLSAADVLLLVTLPLWAAQAAQRGGWSFGDFLCKISGAAFNVNFYFGIFLLACISLDLYFSIVRGSRLFSQKRPRLGHITCWSIWLACLFLASPDYVFLAVKKDPAQGRALCVHRYSRPLTDWQLASRVLRHALGFLLPAAALALCWSRVLPRPQRRRAVAVFLPLVAAFCLCWVPYNVALIVDTARSRAKEPGEHAASLETALGVTSALGCAHACLRPLLYFGLCGNVRKRTVAMLRCAGEECEGSLWELGGAEGAEGAPREGNPGGEALKPLTSKDQQVQVQVQVQATPC
ncbi:C-X-C chemokine receptor type 3-like [Pungitius pungitius]|uniref:C-X-C chemokine receptor type 3-like n=1 Tax=Pungitius pungitius TaxID=134920 RepID=UPI002E128CFA